MGALKLPANDRPNGRTTARGLPPCFPCKTALQCVKNAVQSVGKHGLPTLPCSVSDVLTKKNFHAILILLSATVMRQTTEKKRD